MVRSAASIRKLRHFGGVSLKNGRMYHKRTPGYSVDIKSVGMGVRYSIKIAAHRYQDYAPTPEDLIGYMVLSMRLKAGIDMHSTPARRRLFRTAPLGQPIVFEESFHHIPILTKKGA